MKDSSTVRMRRAVFLAKFSCKRYLFCMAIYPLLELGNLLTDSMNLMITISVLYWLGSNRDAVEESERGPGVIGYLSGHRPIL